MKSVPNTRIEEGPIPDDVLAFTDSGGNRARREPGGPWEVLRKGLGAGWMELTIPVWMWAEWPVQVTGTAGSVQEPEEIILERAVVPDESVVLVGIPSGNHWNRDYSLSRDGETYWTRQGQRRGLPGVLAAEGKVRVVLAPARQPRTFPKLDADPGDLKAFRGRSGQVYRQAGMSPILGLPVYERMVRMDDTFRHFATALLQVWQAVDGPLEEITEAEERAQRG